MLKASGVEFEQKLVSFPSPHHKTEVEINTVIAGKGPPLVLLHGFGAVVGFWISNLKELSKHHKVYAVDLPGFGRSSRPDFKGKTAEEAEEFFMTALEGWTNNVGLKGAKFNLLGHSFGAYLAACYTLRNPAHVSRLILADPWGVPVRPTIQPNSQNASFRIKFFRTVVTWFNPNPLGIIRFAGPYGLNLITRFRGDLVEKFVDYFPAEDPVVASYIYHLNTQHPSGEKAFTTLTIPVGYAKKPLSERLQEIPASVPVTMLYGDHSWMDPRAGKAVQEKLGASRVDFHILDNCGHHIYVDNAAQFNYLVLGACQQSNQAGSNPEKMEIFV